MYKLGVSSGWHFVDVFSIDNDGLQTIPRPVLAVLLLLPVGQVKEKKAMFYFIYWLEPTWHVCCCCLQ